ncbi:MAG TPA: zf-TFIIB domain-containing protein [Candidatus Ignatzschineria merdigallinarum]|uniref:Zf-TFIIB domain-containing protein n=1 Tax=Candidatus Ignatzschineria merdigallinarum TaxID=2838621 RepID=A0A9D1TTL4_9GAMM|nr:zf-TFIIB domain-containing protein [Candidatus Ignatzschineria merdigallinarum]
MKCPVCKDVTLSISSRQNIEIDFCPECRGVWLDRGELDKIIELSTQSQPELRQDSRHHHQDEDRHSDRRHNDYRRDDRDYDRRDEKSYRKRSFLMDLFD